MTNRVRNPRLCVVFFPPYDTKQGRRPHGVVLTRCHAATVEELLCACVQGVPPKELTSARGNGDFFVGHETNFDANRPPSEYKGLVPWNGHDQSGHYLEFIRRLAQPFFQKQAQQQAA